MRTEPHVHQSDEARYRCAECGRSDRLTAIAYGYMEGSLAANGYELDDYSETIEDTEVCEDTIRCRDCGESVIEKRVDGRWCRWVRCELCGGSEQPKISYYGCERCKGGGGYDVPVQEAERAPA